MRLGFGVCGLPAFFRGALCLHAGSYEPVSHPQGKWEVGGDATLAENGLGNLKRFLICKIFILLPGDCSHACVSAKGIDSLHGIAGV